MSFSPEISTSHAQVVNVFTRYNAGEPFPSYDIFLEENIAIRTPINFRATPLSLPTLLSFDRGREPAYATEIRDIGADYLIYCIKSVITEPPNLSSATDRSGFFAWDEGFLSTIMTRVWAYENGLPGASDNYLQVYQTGQISDAWYYKNSSDQSPGRDAIQFYETEWAAAPFDVFYADIRYALGVTERELLNFTDRRTQLSITQVLYSTKIIKVRGDTPFLTDEDGLWPSPTEMTAVQQAQGSYPNHGVPYPVEGGTAGDVQLYNNTINHHYDSGYDYVRQSLKSTFKTPAQIQTNSEEYVASIVTGINELLSTTSEAPKGSTTRRQASPRALRENYTTFAQLSSESTSPNTTTPSPSTTISMPGGGGGGGGSY